MAQSHETGFHSCSPHSSSGGADSYKHEGTPDTRLTAFSPEGNSAKSTKPPTTLNMIASINRPGAFPVDKANGYRDSEGQDDKDPFISKESDSKLQRKLSATASDFRPHIGQMAASGHDKPAREYFQQPVVSTYLSSEMDISRSLLVSSPSKRLPEAEVEEYTTYLDRLGYLQGTKQISPRENGVVLRFTNIRDAFAAYQNIKLGGADWAAIFVPTSDTAMDASLEPVFPPPAPEGQLSLLARVHQGHMDPIQVESFVLQILHDEGDLFAFQKHASFHNGALTATVEFADVNVAADFYSKYNSATVEGVQLILTFHKIAQPPRRQEHPAGLATPTSTPLRGNGQDISAAFSGLSVGLTPPSNRSASLRGQTHHSQALSVASQPAIFPVMYRPSVMSEAPVLYEAVPRIQGLHMAGNGLSLPGPFYTPALSPQAPSGHEDITTPRSMHARSSYGRRQNALRVTRSSFYSAAGHHNHVDVHRIREGIDVRTTIMLRNIPNKVDQAMLKRLVDESSWGKYDFMYLRIDFANDCNVGYAFINFVDPLDIIDFVNARGNQRWNCFKSDKVAEISYATIQGKDCLVQKFRNSSVMLEASHYRPKLYFTSNGPMPDLAGQEESFPEPDNQSKMKRSCENAEHVGLFTPNAGQYFRDEQRRRRSQYDRGTRLAALEEYDFESNMQRLYPL